MPSLRRRTILGLCALVTIAAAPGCGLFGLIETKSVANVRFFATHAGTQDESGDYPDYGDAQTTRVFVTEGGWQVSLSEVYVTTAEVRLVECGGPATAIEMFWGPCPEPFVSNSDLDSVPLGGVTVPDGEYCSVDVVFGPFMPPEEGDDHVAVATDKIYDNTIYVAGVARRGEGETLEEVPFEIASKRSVTTRIDVGSPLVLDNENFPSDLTIIKTYDTFFDGIDFAVDGPDEIEDAIYAALEVDTYPYKGVFDLD